MHFIKIFIVCICLIFLISCGYADDRIDEQNIGKYKTTYIIYWTTYEDERNTIYTDNEVYVCSFQGTNFLLEKDNKEELLSTTATIRIIKSEKLENHE